MKENISIRELNRFDTCGMDFPIKPIKETGKLKKEFSRFT